MLFRSSTWPCPTWPTWQNRDIIQQPTWRDSQPGKTANLAKQPPWRNCQPGNLAKILTWQPGNLALNSYLATWRQTPTWQPGNLASHPTWITWQWLQPGLKDRVVARLRTHAGLPGWKICRVAGLRGTRSKAGLESWAKVPFARLGGCLLPDPTWQGFGNLAAGLLGCQVEVAVLPSWRVGGFRLLSCQVAGWPGCQVAGLPGCWVAV